MIALESRLGCVVVDVSCCREVRTKNSCWKNKGRRTGTCNQHEATSGQMRLVNSKN